MFRSNWLKISSVFGMLFLMISCGGSSEVNSGEDIMKLVGSRSFEVENQWAIPLGGGMINLIGNPNYIRFKKDSDSVEVFLPYFGVRHSGGGYGDSGGIKFKGIPKELTVEELNKDDVQISFVGNNGNENFQFMLKIFSNGNSTTSVNSTQRNSITYRGNIKPVNKED
ncbi:DUF4251 domain-containing protein [Zunongwangia sp. F363]|uniref:DUF4251 domain-containing protein n=1 Tax=Autumnicola tepida TaxID=3075595 RepID=A0ABU3C654_9FLAO|nr:DUF4251 domain-containing protein [Zunongwangia sp. F363]MDT0641823.1 DUF4251 domain-containing protein [Zunongwangia sp. F363]